MKKNSKVVSLSENKQYTTYQFYGEMDNLNTDVKDGLKLAILYTFEWLRNRFENTVPKELYMPKHDDYKKVDDKKFKTFTLNNPSAYIQVESDIDNGFWSLMINEMDSGNINENRIPIHGRYIQSDIGYRIVSGKLECAFKTTIKDNVNNKELADCVRFSLIRTLGFDSNFGLKQINSLFNKSTVYLEKEGNIVKFKDILNSKENSLPFVIYTYDDHSLSKKDVEQIQKTINLDVFSKKTTKSLLENIDIQENDNKNTDDIHLRIDAYMSRYLGLARLYYLPKKSFGIVSKIIGTSTIKTNEVLFVEPLKRSVKRYEYPSKKEELKEYVKNYTRCKEYNFHDVLFVDQARILKNILENEEKIKTAKLLDSAIDNLNQIKKKQEKDIRIESYEKKHNSNNELSKVEDDYKKVLEINEVLKRENIILSNEKNKQKELIDYLQRSRKHPNKHSEICKWVKDFKYVTLHQKACDCLSRRDAESVSIDMICDALDFLEYVYSQYLFSKMPIETVNDKSSYIYNRPYEVTPSGIPTSAKGDCKIKYSFNDEKRKEYPLSEHLKIGSHGEILRIYFIVDKKRKKIVIGSLPNHLEY